MAASGAFAEAYSTVENVEQLVESRVQAATATATQLQSTALQTVSALGNVNLNFNAGSPPAPPNIDPSINVNLNLPNISPTSFGTITSNVPNTPALDPVPAIPDLTIPDFVSSIGSLNIPNAPAWTAPPQVPTEPTIDDVVVPDMPALVIPAASALEEITVPDFAGLTLPLFDATAPEFEGSALPGILQWTEPTYHPEIIDDVVVQLRKLWDGGSGIPAAVEQAMWARAAEREDLTAERELDSVSEEFSMRGFTMPPGMQAARVDQLRGDPAEAAFHRRIADIEDRLHLLDRSVRLDEHGDEDLIVDRHPRERGQFKGSLDRDLIFRNVYFRNQESFPPRHRKKSLPTVFHMFLRIPTIHR